MSKRIIREAGESIPPRTVAVELDEGTARDLAGVLMYTVPWGGYDAAWAGPLHKLLMKLLDEDEDSMNYTKYNYNLSEKYFVKAP